MRIHLKIFIAIFELDRYSFSQKSKGSQIEVKYDI